MAKKWSPHQRGGLMQDLGEITAAVLAGGLGIRLRPVVADRPKVLAKVRGRPFLTFLLDQLASAGLNYVVLCTGYLGDQVRAALGEGYNGMKLVYSQESPPQGTAGALRLALPLFKSDPVLVLNGDSFCQVDLRAFFSWHLRRRANASLVLAKVSNTQRYGQVRVDEDGRILRFEEKGQEEGAGWINGGVYLISRDVLLTIPETGAVSLEQEVFPAWVGRGLCGYKNQGSFLDIGTPEAYAVAEDFFAGI